MKRISMIVVAVLVCAWAVSLPVCADVVDFDAIAATGFFTDVVPGGERGPTLVFPGVTFDGGVVMSNAGWLNLATSTPNLYGTSDFLPLNDGSLLPGFITATFSSPVSFVGFDVINGKSFASNFTLEAFDASSGLLGSASIGLDSFSSGAGAVGSFSFFHSGIASIKVTSNQGAGNIDFAIDTVRFSSESNPVPEPSSLLALMSGLPLAGYMLRRRRS